MRRKQFRFLASVGAAFALTLGASACGDGDDGGGDGGPAAAATGVPEEFAAVTAAAEGAQEGGDLVVLSEGDIDYMDPGAAYYQVSYMVTLATQRGLVGWEPDDIEEPTPDLAEGPAEVSEDGKTVTFTIHDGVKFSPPVDRVVTTADVKYAIERTLLPGIPNGYTSVYLQDVEGFEDAVQQVKDDETVAPEISGIETPDDTTIVFHLTDPSAQGVIGALSLPLSAPVPEEYAAEFDAETPSTYGDHVVFTGPYMVENNAEGELVGYTPGKEIKLIRNPNWDSETDFRPAYLDTITFQEGFADPTSASKKILTGESSINGDFPPSKTIVQDVASGEYEAGQMLVTPSGGNRYIALDTTQEPFNDINVRKAVIANADRVELRNSRGGELFGPVMNHMIPPLIPGFEEAGGLEAPEGLDYLASDTGDPELAAEYMRKAGYESGKCEGDCEVTMVGDDAPPGRDTAEVFQGQLEELGFDVTFQPVEHAIMYTKFCSVPTQQPDVCPNVGWIKDFNDPQSFFDIPFYGPAINPSNNSNWGRVDDPELNKAIDEARLILDPDERAEAYAEVDRIAMEQAAVVPWVWDNDILVQSPNVNGVVNLFNGLFDLSFTSLK